jgi:hypothetical protein
MRLRLEEHDDKDTHLEDAEEPEAVKVKDGR